MAALKSRRILVDHQTPLTVEIDMPSLYPSDTDEFFSTCSLDEILSLKSGWVHLKANGQMLINAPAPHFESTADQITIGENRISNVYEYAPGFTARILSIERARYAAPSGFDQADGPLEMILTLKAIPGASEALLATGPSGSPDALLVACTASGQCRFSVKTADGPALTSQPVAVDLGSRHTLIVQWGGFYASGDRRRRVSVRLDDKPVLSGNVDFHFSVPQAVAIGSAFPSSPAFSGLVHSVRRLPSSAQLP
jgi:hypothetical protein